MPFRSEKQRRYLWKFHPDIARRWTKEHGSKIVPSKKKKNEEIDEQDVIILIESEDMYSGLHLSPKEKDIISVKKKMSKNKKTIGVDSAFWEQNVIRKQYPSFYKKRVSTKVGHDKKGLPINPYSWLPRSS